MFLWRNSSIPGLFCLVSIQVGFTQILEGYFVGAEESYGWSRTDKTEVCISTDYFTYKTYLKQGCVYAK